MGLQPVDERAWLCVPPDIEARLAEKRRLYRERPQEVLAELSAAREAALEAAECVVRATGVAREQSGAWIDGDRHSVTPLGDAALGVAEDLCVMIPADETYVLGAASLCSPSHWRLAEKLGRPMHEIHGPVAGLQPRIGAEIARFLERLPEERVFLRGNWHLHPDDRRFAPESSGWATRAVISASEVAQWFVRTERQTLRRLSASGAVLFTILVEHIALADLTQEDVSDLLAGYARMSDEERDERGHRVFGQAFEAWARGRGVA